MPGVNLSDELKKSLLSVADHFDQEDRAVRERQIRTYRRMKLYWNNFTNLWYDEVAHDWRIYDPQQETSENPDQAYYDRPANIFRAYLESIIAALSVTIPGLACYPDDATNNLDIQTAKAGDRIIDLVRKHNNDDFLWLNSLYVYCTEGMVAAYNYPKEDERFGTYEEKQYEKKEVFKYICPECQQEIDDAVMAQSQVNQMQSEDVIADIESFDNMERDEFMPEDHDIEIQDALNKEQLICPHCAAELDPDLQKTPLIITRLVGTTQHPKSRVCLEAYGGLYVKIPNYAKKQEDMPYLRFSREVHYSIAIEMFPQLAGKVQPAQFTGMYDPYETWGRLSTQYNGEYPINNSTISTYWFRPSAFNTQPEDVAAALKKKFPNGCKLVKVNDMFAEAHNEALDDCWTITHNPLSDYLNFDPLGMLLVSMQDITNEIVSLILQTMEHGIPQGFADPTVLNFNQYRQTEVAPGTIFPARNKTGKSLGEAFYEIKTATMSPETIPLADWFQQIAQTIVGAQPSIFGGQLEGSKTASEYSMSRAQALQRLQTPWKMMINWWKEIFGKVITMYLKIAVDDEKLVRKDEKGNFINIFIRKAELQGKIGSIEFEGSENLPLTWMQQKDVIMGLMQAGNPILMQALMAPENLPMLRRAIGLTEFVIPGEDDRNKQYEEIGLLINSEPIVVPSSINEEEAGILEEQGMPAQSEQEFPSVEVDPDIDNHQIEADVCRSWLVSEAGRVMKFDNPDGYRNVLLHFKQHVMYLQMQAMQNAAVSPEEENNAGGKAQNAALAAPKEQEDSDGQRSTVQ